MPSYSQRIVGAISSICITVGGAWLASHAHSTAAGAATMSFPSGVTVTFAGIRNTHGNVVVMVFNDRESYKTYDVNQAAGYLETIARKGTVTVSFPELKTGPYAITAFHDEDSNQDLNMGDEWPLEGYATSGATDIYDTPTFRRATIKDAMVTVTMYYAE
jgi:uncharacterized protein (DUF2141 family)